MEGEGESGLREPTPHISIAYSNLYLPPGNKPLGLASPSDIVH